MFPQNNAIQKRLSKIEAKDYHLPYSESLSIQRGKGDHIIIHIIC